MTHVLAWRVSPAGWPLWRVGNVFCESHTIAPGRRAAHNQAEHQARTGNVSGSGPSTSTPAVPSSGSLPADREGFSRRSGPSSRPRSRCRSVLGKHGTADGVAETREGAATVPEAGSPRARFRAVASEGVGKDLAQASLLGPEMLSSSWVCARLSVQIPSSYQDTPHSGSGSTLMTPLNAPASVETPCPEEFLGVRTWTLGSHSPLTSTPSPTADNGLASHPVARRPPSFPAQSLLCSFMGGLTSGFQFLSAPNKGVNSLGSRTFLCPAHYCVSRAQPRASAPRAPSTPRWKERVHR